MTCLDGPAAVQRLGGGGIPVTLHHGSAKPHEPGKARPTEIERHRDQGVPARRRRASEGVAELIGTDGCCQRDVICQQTVNLVIGKAAVGQKLPPSGG